MVVNSVVSFLNPSITGTFELKNFMKSLFSKELLFLCKQIFFIGCFFFSAILDSLTLREVKLFEGSLGFFTEVFLKYVDENLNLKKKFDHKKIIFVVKKKNQKFWD